MLYAILRVYSVCIAWTVPRGLGQFNKWLCCSFGFVWFARFGVFEGVTCFISAVFKTRVVLLYLFIVFVFIVFGVFG